MDDDGSSDDRVEVARRRERVGDVEGQDALADADVTLQGGGRRERQGARAELRQDVGEGVGRVVPDVGERDADRRDRGRVHVKAQRVGAELQGRTGGAREVGAGVQDDARETERARRGGADAQGTPAEGDVLVRDEGVDGPVRGEERG